MSGFKIKFQRNGKFEQEQFLSGMMSTRSRRLEMESMSEGMIEPEEDRPSGRSANI